MGDGSRLLELGTAKWQSQSEGLEPWKQVLAGGSVVGSSAGTVPSPPPQTKVTLGQRDRGSRLCRDTVSTCGPGVFTLPWGWGGRESSKMTEIHFVFQSNKMRTLSDLLGFLKNN